MAWWLAADMYVHVHVQVVFLDDAGQPLHSAADISWTPSAPAWTPTSSGPVSKPKRPNKSRKGGGGKRR